MKLYNRKFLALILVTAIGLMAACSTIGGGEVGVNTGSDGVALRGFDAVAYFAVESAVRGDSKYEYAWNGAKWLFSNAENLEKFKSSPESYAPQFGGYCSFAVSKGYTADADPNAWKVVDGKLYLNYNEDVKQMWEKDQNVRISDGEKNWKEFQKKKPEHKG